MGPLVTLQGGSAACSVYDNLFNPLFPTRAPFNNGFFHICPNMKNGFQYTRCFFEDFRSNEDAKFDKFGTNVKLFARQINCREVDRNEKH